MKTNHTPGAWHVAKHDDNGDTLICTDNGDILCNVSCDTDIEPEQTDANARLIAAAPDLLEVALDIHQAIAQRLDPKDFFYKLKHAISKAI